MKTFSKFLKDESGATAIEYGLIAAILSVAIIVTLQFVGSELDTTYSTIGSALQTANG